MQYDLHNHSYFSDGELSPEELVVFAKQQGVDVLALTDHDSVAGIARAQAEAQLQQLRFIAGVEISTLWMLKDIHIIGLSIDPQQPELLAGLQLQQAKREQRAQQIGERLEKIGIKNALAGARALAGSTTLTRPHFARYMVAEGYVKDMKTAFSRYLGHGKPASVRTEWASIAEAVQWIHAAGGQAVLAHPARYKLARTKFIKLLECFVAAGGDAMEVVTGSHSAQETQAMAEYCQKYQLLASIGSDFHGHTIGYCRLGRLPKLPAECKEVWTKW